MSTTDEIKKYIKENKAIIGTEETIKGLKKGTIREVFLSANCPENVKETIQRYVKISSIKMNELDIPNDELGVICKKPFPISVLSVVQEK